jgi:hypothetical protein
MPDRNSIVIGCIVMPPAHGKSHLHGFIPNVLEADSVFNCKGTTELAILQRRAKETDDWLEYDIKWMDQVLTRLPQAPCILLVPSPSIAVIIRAPILGRLQLEDYPWQLNLNSRAKVVADVEYSRQSGDDVLKFHSNGAISITVKQLAHYALFEYYVALTIDEAQRRI